MSYMSELDLEIRDAVEAGVSPTDVVRQYGQLFGTDQVYAIIEEYEGDSEDDGQPSEAQEWHDFDPDC